MADVMSPAKRRALMARIKGRDTGLEQQVFAALKGVGIRFRRHVRVLRGCTPDVVLPHLRIAIFVDGDFWHGWQFPRWQSKLSPFWAEKIEGNRRRDRRNFAALRRRGWVVLRLWEHDIERDLRGSIARVEDLVGFQEKAAAKKRRSVGRG